MLRMISCHCQNGHELGMSMMTHHQASKIVCHHCRIVVKDRKGPIGGYELIYRDVKDNETIIPRHLLQDVPKLLQWFCPSLSNSEAEAIAIVGNQRHTKISVGETRALIEEQIPLLRNRMVVGEEAIESLRVSVAAIEKELGLPKAAKEVKTISERLDTLLEKDDSIKQEAIASSSTNIISAIYDELTKITNKASRRTINPQPVIAPDPKKSTNGLTCNRCKQHYPYAEQANQSDGTFLCYGCKINY